MNPPVSNCYAFGPFLLDPTEQVLLRDGVSVTLTAKVFETLLLLVRNSGRAMEKEDLINQLWPNTFVEEGNLTQSISRLRKLLGQNEGEDYIETLPRRGYRFRAQVKEVAAEGVVTLLQRKRVKGHLTITEVLEETSDDRLGLADSGTDARSIAILPFTALGTPPEYSYLGLGLADSLITQLGTTRQLAVRPTSAVRQYAEQPQDSIRIGRDLRVRAVLEGSLQIAGDRVRITVQLVGVKEAAPLWAHKFDLPFTDIFTVQDSIAEQVAAALLLQLSQAERQRMIRRYTADAEAYQAYLKGRYYWNKRTLDGYHRAIECFDRAVERDATYALAYVGLADIYNLLPVWGDRTVKESCPLAKAAALRAIELDEHLAEAHASLGYALMHHDWDLAAGERSLHRSIELNPNYATAHQWYAKLLVAMGRFDEAKAEMALAQDLDPLSLMVSTAVGGPYLYGGEYAAAIDLFTQVLELEANFVPALYSISLAYTFAGRTAEAVSALEKILARSDEPPFALVALAATYAIGGDDKEARATLKRFKSKQPDGRAFSYALAGAHANLGENDEAFKWLEVSFEQRDGRLIDLNVDPYFNRVRDLPRFRELIIRLVPPPEN
ncbi:MAG: winged helix-turn-helix domain-containing protein [Pyrinomonadaceae bacterium]